MTLRDEKFRSMFAREAIINSDWYIARLKKYRTSQIEHLSRGLEYVKNFIKHRGDDIIKSRINLRKREETITKKLNFVQTDTYLKGLIGTLGK
jgi:hypothetical protein